MGNLQIDLDKNDDVEYIKGFIDNLDKMPKPMSELINESKSWSIENDELSFQHSKDVRLLCKIVVMGESKFEICAGCCKCY